MERKTLILSEPEVRQCIDLDDVFKILEETFREAGRGQAILPPKLIMNIPAEGHADYLIAGPARENPQERNLVCITGIGTPDVTVGKYIYEKALKLKLGTPIKLF
jgi:ornithine cyclodeaminase/alanine dehydrogenase-like protein (mu-crystallin family)